MSEPTVEVGWSDIEQSALKATCSLRAAARAWDDLQKILPVTVSLVLVEATIRKEMRDDQPSLQPGLARAAALIIELMKVDVDRLQNAIDAAELAAESYYGNRGQELIDAALDLLRQAQEEA